MIFTVCALKLGADCFCTVTGVCNVSCANEEIGFALNAEAIDPCS